MKIAVLGNCQARAIARVIDQLIPDSEVAVYHMSRIARDNPAMDPLESWYEEITEAEVAFVVSPIGKEFRLFTDEALKEDCKKLIRFPYIVFTGYHPDCCYIQGKSGQCVGPMGTLHSTIAAAAYTMGLTTSRAKKLFNRFVFARLNYESKYSSSHQGIISNCEPLNFHLSHLFETGRCSMHTINHPNTSVLEEIARQALKLADVPFDPNLKVEIHDELNDQASWPVYPGLFSGIPGNFNFRLEEVEYGLEKFLELEYEAFSEFIDIDCHINPQIEQAISAIKPELV